MKKKYIMIIFIIILALVVGCNSQKQEIIYNNVTNSFITEDIKDIIDVKKIYKLSYNPEIGSMWYFCKNEDFIFYSWTEDIYMATGIKRAKIYQMNLENNNIEEIYNVERSEDFIRMHWLIASEENIYWIENGIEKFKIVKMNIENRKIKIIYEKERDTSSVRIAATNDSIFWTEERNKILTYNEKEDEVTIFKDDLDIGLVYTNMHISDDILVYALKENNGRIIIAYDLETKEEKTIYIDKNTDIWNIYGNKNYIAWYYEPGAETKIYFYDINREEYNYIDLGEDYEKQLSKMALIDNYIIVDEPKRNRIIAYDISNYKYYDITEKQIIHAGNSYHQLSISLDKYIIAIDGGENEENEGRNTILEIKLK